MRGAVTVEFATGSEVLGATLGAIVRDKLIDSNLRGRFGGLKKFVAKYFPEEILWCGKRGLDDIYKIQMMHLVGLDNWRNLDSGPSAALWSAVSPDTRFRYAWSPISASVLIAPKKLPLADGLVPIENFTIADHKNIARQFVRSEQSLGESSYSEGEAAARSDELFATFVEKHGLVSKWASYRVETLITEFVRRLRLAGTDAETSLCWAALMRSSERRGRPLNNLQRKLKTESPKATPKKNPINVRSVALKAIALLPEAELAELKLPLGVVLIAVEAVTKGTSSV